MRPSARAVRAFAACRRLNLARPHCLRDLTNKIDREQTVYEIGVCHLDVVRQIEPALECPAGDAMVEIELLLAGSLAARDAPVQRRADLCRDRAGDFLRTG